jgi:hypothetical protein
MRKIRNENIIQEINAGSIGGKKWDTASIVGWAVFYFYFYVIVNKNQA